MKNIKRVITYVIFLAAAINISIAHSTNIRRTSDIELDISKIIEQLEKSKHFSELLNFDDCDQFNEILKTLEKSNAYLVEVAKREKVDLLKALKKPKINNIIKSGSGATGVYLIGKENSAPKVVLKRTSKDIAYAEYTASYTLRKSGFNIPTYEVINHNSPDLKHVDSFLHREDLSTKNAPINSVREKITEISTNNKQLLSLSVMSAVPGMSIDDAIKKGYKIKNHTKQQKMAKEIGRLLIYDLVLGNNDRCWIGTDNSINSNPGNLMIDPSDDSIYAIDNSFLSNDIFGFLSLVKGAIKVPSTQRPCLKELMSPILEENDYLQSENELMSLFEEGISRGWHEIYGKDRGVQFLNNLRKGIDSVHADLNQSRHRDEWIGAVQEIQNYFDKFTINN